MRMTTERCLFQLICGDSEGCERQLRVSSLLCYEDQPIDFGMAGVAARVVLRQSSERLQLQIEFVHQRQYTVSLVHGSREGT